MLPRPVLRSIDAASLAARPRRSCWPRARRTPAASFDPTGACTGDGAAPGAYPDLEALIPTAYHDAAPETLDSGRNCSPENLGSLAAAGIDEVRFAGGTWTFGRAGRRPRRLHGARADRRPARRLLRQQRRAANRTKIVGQSTPTIAGRPGRRLDTKTGERQQTVVVWPAAEADRVNVVITNDLPDARISDAIEAFGDGLSDGARVAAMTDRPTTRPPGARHGAGIAKHPRSSGHPSARRASRRSATCRSSACTARGRSTSRDRPDRATSASRASRRSPAASTRPAIGAASGRCGCSPASAPPRTRTRGSASCSTPARPACRSPTTCRRCTATTPTTPRPRASSGRAASRSAASPTWRSCSPACRSTGSRRR